MSAQRERKEKREREKIHRGERQNKDRPVCVHEKMGERKRKRKRERKREKEREEREREREWENGRRDVNDIFCARLRASWIQPDAI